MNWRTKNSVWSGKRGERFGNEDGERERRETKRELMRNADKDMKNKFKLKKKCI